jgi:hypothetical protein
MKVKIPSKVNTCFIPGQTPFLEADFSSTIIGMGSCRAHIFAAVL